MANKFRTKIAINAMRDNGNLITYNREFSWSANSQKTFLIARCTLPRQPNIGQNRLKSCKISANLSYSAIGIFQIKSL